MSEGHRLAKAPDVTFGRPRLMSEMFVEALLRDAELDAARYGGVESNDAEAELPRDRLLKVEEAAAYVGVHRNTVYAAVKSGALTPRRAGRLLRFTIADLDEWTARS